MKQVIPGGNNDALSNSATEYNSLMGGGAWDSTQIRSYQVIPTGGTLRKLRIKLSAAPTTNPYVFTIMKNGSATTLTCTVAVGSTTAEDSTHEVTFAAGDYVTIRSSYSSAPGNTPSAQWSTEWEGSTAGEYIILGNGYRSTATSYYCGIYNSSKLAIYTAEYQSTRNLMYPAGTYKKFYGYLSIQPSNGLVLTLRKDGVDTTQTFTISGTSQTGNDTTHTTSGSGIDGWSISFVESGNVAACYMGWGLVFCPTTDGDIPFSGNFPGPSADNQYHYLLGTKPTDSWLTVDAPRLITSAMTLKAMDVDLNAKCGAGASVIFTVYKNGSATAMTVSCPDNYGGEYTGDVSVEAGDVLSLRYDETGTPTTRPSVCIGILARMVANTAKSVTDSLAVSEGLSIKARMSLADSLAVSEALAVRVKAAIADSLAISESPGIHVHALVADSLAISESLGIKVKALITDTIALSEALSIHVHALVADTLNISEMVTRLNGNIQKLVTDALSIAESISVSAHLKVSDSLTLAEVLGVKARLAMADSLSLSDALALKAWLRITDMLSVNESLNAKALVKVQDSMTLAEVLGVKAWLSITDSLSVTDAVALKVTVKVLDSLTISEALALLQKIKVTDSLAISEVIDANEVILMILNMILGADLDLSMSTRSDLELSMGLRSDLELAIAFEGGA